MKAIMKTAPGVGHMEVRDVPVPDLQPGEVLVQISHSGLCGTDLLVYDGVYRGRKRPVPDSLIIGHEAAGEIVAIGSGVSGLKVGTRVAMESLEGCGACFQCERGSYNLCQNWHHLGLTKNGLLAEVAAVPAVSLFPLPDEVSNEAASFLEPLATMIAMTERVKPTRGSSAAIIGPGPLGSLAFQVLQAAGVEPIVVLGRPGDEQRLALLASLGAETFVSVDRESATAEALRRSERGFDIVVEAAGKSAAIQTGLDIVASQGTLVSLGITPPTEIAVLQVMRKNLTWIGVVASVRRHWTEAIRLIANGTLHPERLITHRMALDDGLSGFDALRRREATKVTFLPGG